MTKKNTVQLPAIDGSPEDYYYMTCNSRKLSGEIMSKNEMKKRFKDRFDYDPETVFYGPPNGSLIYAGPLTRTPESRTSAEDPGNLQLELEME